MQGRGGDTALWVQPKTLDSFQGGFWRKYNFGSRPSVEICLAGKRKVQERGVQVPPGLFE